MMLMHAWYEGSIVSQNYNRIRAYELNYLEVHQFTQALDATMECSNFFRNSADSARVLMVSPSSQYHSHRPLHLQQSPLSPLPSL